MGVGRDCEDLELLWRRADKKWENFVSVIINSRNLQEVEINKTIAEHTGNINVLYC